MDVFSRKYHHDSRSRSGSLKLGQGPLDEKDRSNNYRSRHDGKSYGDYNELKKDAYRNSRRDENNNCNNSKKYGAHRSRSKCQRKSKSPQSQSKNSIINIDKEGYLIMNERDVLNNRYEVVKILGEGTFGRVARCMDYNNKSQDVAIKVIKSVSKYRKAALLEIKVLDKIKKYDAKGRNLCLFSLDWFDYHGHICICFPLLGPSVYDFLSDNDFVGYPIHQVRYMSEQMVRSIEFLHSLKITHTDLKPENILFVDGAFDVKYDAEKGKNVKIIRDASLKIIDFGNAIFDYEDHSSVVATRHYRPLEVVLQLGWSYSCDVWSLGCIIFEIYTGTTMFMTHDNIEHLAMMERILGHFPVRMTRRTKKQKYFDSCGRLRWDQDSKDGKYVRSEVKPIRQYTERHKNIEVLDLFDLIEEMLEYNPDKRITLREARKHPFISNNSSSELDKSFGRTRS